MNVKDSEFVFLEISNHCYPLRSVHFCDVFDFQGGSDCSRSDKSLVILYSIDVSFRFVLLKVNARDVSLLHHHRPVPLVMGSLKILCEISF